ncbi:hypothetical protein QAD02_017951 [Eretmocerus hayati]|uniref:Uncharacterized protein n=1 Tax=Eretmocerus hayati TaxID=131215 RepID=A0ACC2PHV5_9HYME|nr:hypothetical protein QAD02_017951 [Eretmocerus hayati]
MSLADKNWPALTTKTTNGSTFFGENSNQTALSTKTSGSTTATNGKRSALNTMTSDESKLIGDRSNQSALSTEASDTIEPTIPTSVTPATQTSFETLDNESEININEANSILKNSTSENSDDLSTIGSTVSEVNRVSPPATEPHEINLMPPPKTKRALSKSSSQASVASRGSNSPSTGEQGSKKVTKRPKIIKLAPTIEEVRNLMEPAYEHLNSIEDKSPISTEQLLLLLHEVKSGKSVSETAKKYTNDFQALDGMLDEMYPHLTSSGFKRSITRIKQRLRNADAKDYMSSDDQSSTSEVEDQAVMTA